MGQLIIVSSVSGAGKTTLVDDAISKYDLYKLKTCTTRKVRPEENGSEYYFYNKDEFSEYIKTGQFFEHAEVYGNYYGLLNTEIEKFKESNTIVVLDVQGSATARELYPEAITIFIEPPSIDELKYRILKRNTGGEDAERRLAELDIEMKEMPKFTHIVKYGTLDEMTNQFGEIIKSLL
jgi:guanylate kinase